MIVTMTITLFTSRVILQMLGVEDFGIYNVIGGVIGIFQFINISLSEGTQRFITFEIGKGENGNIKSVFSTCFLLHLALGILIIIISEPIGLWFIKNKLMIPEPRLHAAILVFHFSIITAFVSIICVPFYALIIANERMKTFAFISIIEALIKLGIVYLLQLSNHLDRLILYGLLMLISQVFIQSLYYLYCKIKLKGSTISIIFDLRLIKEIGRFSSWTIIGSLSCLGVTQGINLLLGTFFLPAVNAARGIAVQVQNAVNIFVKNFQVAINPQITKTYAVGQLTEVHKLVFKSAKYSFFLFMFPGIPILLEIDMILSLWLTEVPEYTATFVRIIILASWVNTLANPLGIAARASGNIKKFELFAASIKLFVIPCGYICLKNGLPPASVFVLYFLFETLAFISNSYITSTLVHYKITDFYKYVVFRCLIVLLIAAVIPGILIGILKSSIYRLILIIITSTISSSITIYVCGLSCQEKTFFREKFIELLNKYTHKP